MEQGRICFSHARSQRRLVCFPGAGGIAATFRRWAYLFDDLELWAIEYPGHGSRRREASADTFARLVEDSTEAVMPLLSEETVFLGHSLGAMVAFEVARSIQQASPLQGLVVVACDAPHLAVPPKLISPETILVYFERAGLQPNALDIRQRWSWWQSVLRVRSTYRYVQGQALTCPIVAFAGREDEEIRLDDLLGWQEHTTQEFSAYHIPGEHFLLREPLFLSLLAQELHQLQEKAYTRV